MSINNANVISIYLDGTAVAHATSDGLSLSKEVIETTNKGSGGDFDGISGKKSGTLSIEGFVDPAVNQSFDDLYDLFRQDAVFAWKYTDETVGNSRYEGNAIFTSLERSGGSDEAETFTGEIQIVGTPTKVSVT